MKFKTKCLPQSNGKGHPTQGWRVLNQTDSENILALSVLDQEVRITKTGMEIPENTTEKAWEGIGQRLGDTLTVYQWLVGDWWVFGEEHYGNRRHIVESPTWTGPAFGTCMNSGCVSRAFKTSRRRDLLSFRHHTELVPLLATNPELVPELMDWAEEPVKEGKKKPRSIAAMKKEMRRRLNKHFEPMKRKKAAPKDYTYIELIDAIEALAKQNFHLANLAKVQVDLFPRELVEEDLASCKKAIETIKQFIKEVSALCSAPPIA